MEPRSNFCAKDEDYVDPFQYRRLAGHLLYLNITRPDTSQFMSNPKVQHFNATSHLIRYLKTSPGQDIFFSSTLGIL